MAIDAVIHGASHDRIVGSSPPDERIDWRLVTKTTLLKSIQEPVNAQMGEAMLESRRGRLVMCVLLVFVGLAMSAAAYGWGQPDGPLMYVYWGILPGAPFVLLGGHSLVPGFSLHAVAGAAIGGLLAVAVPYGSLWYSSATYSGGGANIGLGLLLLALPIYLPVAMLIGAGVGQPASREVANSRP